MGFLQICAGVVLLQLSKSAKDVPDAVVFSGDVDQMRTVAEQEEPEYEPRADTIRGGASLLRSMSKVRQKKQVEEAVKLKEEHMAAIGENEPVIFDGIRRRRTTLESSAAGSIHRRKTIHPPLGMSRFPDQADEGDPDMHPGFFDQFRRRSRAGSRAATPATASDVPPVPLSPLKGGRSSLRARGLSDVSGTSSNRPHIYGLPSGLAPTVEDEDTSYVSPAHSAIHWAPDTADHGSRSRSGTTSAGGVPAATVTAAAASAPSLGEQLRPTSQMAKRQFSFQNVFRKRGESDADLRPSTGRSGHSFSLLGRSGGGSGAAGTSSPTEEERLGLVKGDSQSMLADPDHESQPPQYSDLDDREREAQARPTPSRDVTEARIGESGGRGYSPVKRNDHSSDDEGSPHGKSFM